MTCTCGMTINQAALPSTSGFFMIFKKFQVKFVLEFPTMQHNELYSLDLGVASLPCALFSCAFIT